MTLDEVRDATREAADAAAMLCAHLVRLRSRSAGHFPVAEQLLATWGDEPREQLHALLRMFEQLYDLVGRKLLRGYLLLSGEDAASMSFKNVARRVETLGALPSADLWLEIGATRNRLVHDYPLNSARQASVANAAWDHMDPLIQATDLIISRLHGEQLL